MKISELIDFAEAQAQIEREKPVSETDPERDTSWAATLGILRAMKERGVPESLKD
jgi:hypothetical protein